MSQLRKIRLDRRMTKGDLAEASGLSLKQLRLIEGGVVKPHDATLFKLADALGVEPEAVEEAIEAASAARAA